MTYKITKVETFNKDLERLSAKIPRLKDFVVGLEEILSRKPEVGKKTSNGYMYALAMDQVGEKQPLITAYYLYTRNEVVLLYIRSQGDCKPPPMVL
jgi:hypothetical protein